MFTLPMNCDKIYSVVSLPTFGWDYRSSAGFPGARDATPQEEVKKVALEPGRQAAVGN